MKRIPRDGGANVEAVFESGFSGNYPAPYLTVDDLARLSKRCLSAGHVIRNFEAFEIADELDIPRIDLSLYGETADQKAKSWPERAADSDRFVAESLQSARRETNPIMFIVWTDRPD